MKRLLLIFSATIVLAGCEFRPSQDADPFKGDVTAVNFTSTCSAKNDATGECLQYTCKADETDCSGFANGCVKGGNHYAGTAEGGKCTKVL